MILLCEYFTSIQQYSNYFQILQLDCCESSEFISIILALAEGNPSIAPPEVSEGGFMGTAQNPGDVVVAVIELDGPTTEEVDMTFKTYDACDGNEAKVCFNEISNCPFKTDLGVKVEDRKWLDQTVTVPAETTKVGFQLLLGYSVVSPVLKGYKLY